MDSWKHFDDVELTHNSVHYLMAIYQIQKERGAARGIDIARHLDLTRGSVSVTLGTLRKKKLVHEDTHKTYTLTPEGEDYICSVLSRRRIVERFLTEVLGLSATEAEGDACKIEHLLSDDTGRRMLAFLAFFRSADPAAARFRDEWEGFSYFCNHQSRCETCESTCFMNS